MSSCRVFYCILILDLIYNTSGLSLKTYFSLRLFCNIYCSDNCISHKCFMLMVKRMWLSPCCKWVLMHRLLPEVFQVLNVSLPVPKAALIDFRCKCGCWPHLQFGTAGILRSNWYADNQRSLPECGICVNCSFTGSHVDISFLQLYVGRQCSPLSPCITSVNWFNSWIWQKATQSFCLVVLCQISVLWKGLKNAGAGKSGWSVQSGKG